VAKSDPSQATRAVTDYLAALQASGSSIPSQVSLTDPEARWTAAPAGPAVFAYSTNYLVDVDAGIIVDVEATPAIRSAEVDSARSMLERVEKRLHLKPERLIGDTAYGAAPMLGWLVQQKKIEPHVPVWDKSERTDGTMGRAEFKFDPEQDRYECAGGKYLTSTGRATSDGALLYRASTTDCQRCALKARCCPNTPYRKIPRSVHESSRDIARALANTDAYRHSRKERKKVEMLFAHLKRILKLDRLRLRGRAGAEEEFLLAATAQNLRRMAKWLVPRSASLNVAPA
jgi:hypothetical protein